MSFLYGYRIFKKSKRIKRLKNIIFITMPINSIYKSNIKSVQLSKNA